MNNEFSKNKTGEYVNFKPLLRKGIKYWYVFVISGIICTACGACYYKMAKRTFKINANILIKEEKSSGVSGIQSAMMKSMPFGNLLGGSVSVNDELQLLSSFSTFRETAKTLKLNEAHTLKRFWGNVHYYMNSPISISTELDIADTLQTVIHFDLKIENKSGHGTIKAYTKGLVSDKKIGYAVFRAFPVKLHTDYGTFIIETTPFFKKEKEYNIKSLFYGYDLAAEFLQRAVEISIVNKKANLIGLEISERDTQKGKDILNMIVETYNNEGVRQRREEAANTITFLDQRLEIISKELYGLERDIENYKKKNNLTDIEAEVKAIFSNSGDFKKQQFEIEAQYAIINWVEQFMLESKNQYVLIPLNIGLNDKNVLEGLQKYNDVLLERMKLLNNSHANNPTVEIINEQLDAMRANMVETVRNLKKGFALTRNNLKKQESFLDSRLKGMPTQEREFIDIKRQQFLKQELFMYLLQQKESNSLTFNTTTPKSQIVDPAYALSKPLSPKLEIVLIIILFMTFVMGSGYIILKGYIAQHLKGNGKKENSNK